MDGQAATISIESAAKTIGIGRQLAYRLARDGTLPGVISLGQHRLLVSRVQLEDFLAGKGAAAEPPAVPVEA